MKLILYMCLCFLLLTKISHGLSGGIKNTQSSISGRYVKDMYEQTTTNTPQERKCSESANLIKEMPEVRVPRGLKFSGLPGYLGRQGEKGSQGDPVYLGRKIRIAALNAPSSGKIESHWCATEARRYGYSKNFVTFIYSKNSDMKFLVHPDDRQFPVVNLEGEKLYSSFDSMISLLDSTNTTLDTFRILTFDGKDVIKDKGWLSKAVWTGGPEDNCLWWKSDRDAKGNAGVALTLYENHAVYKKWACYLKLIVLCIETKSAGS